jgi:hypothetical protein
MRNDKRGKVQSDPISMNRAVKVEDNPYPPLSIGKKRKPVEVFHNE